MKTINNIAIEDKEKEAKYRKYQAFRRIEFLS